MTNAEREALRVKDREASIAYYTREMSNAQEYLDGRHRLLYGRKCDEQERVFWQKQVDRYKAEIDKLRAPRCSICYKRWDEQPGTVYCGSQHGTCGICGKPRPMGSCTCMTSTVVEGGVFKVKGKDK